MSGSSASITYSKMNILSKFLKLNLLWVLQQREIELKNNLQKTTIKCFLRVCVCMTIDGPLSAINMYQSISIYFSIKCEDTEMLY